MVSMRPPRIDVGYYPDGRIVQLLDLGRGHTAEIPVAAAPSLPHTRWMPVDVLGKQAWVPLKEDEFAAMQKRTDRT